MPVIKSKVIRVKDPETGIWHDLPATVSEESMRAAERAETAAERAEAAAEYNSHLPVTEAMEAAERAAESAEIAQAAASEALETAQGAVTTANTAKNTADAATLAANSAVENATAAAVAATPDIVTNWLGDNISPADPPVVIDTSLSVTGAAADAKAAGDKINIQKNVATYIENEELLKVSEPFTAGYGINSSGEIFTSSSARKRIATYGFIDISKATEILYSVQTGYRIYIAYYSTNLEAAYIEASGWLTGSSVIQKESTYKYMRLCYASVNDESELTVADADKASISIDYPLYHNVLESLTYKGLISSTNSAAIYTDVDDVKEYGMYAVDDNAYNIPTPQEGTLLVVPKGKTDFSSGLYRYRKTQIFIVCNATGEKNIHMRYMSGSSSWTPNWSEIKDYSLYDTIQTIQTRSLYNSGFTASNFQSGGITESGGNSNNDYRIRTQGYVDVRGRDSIHYSVDDGYRIYVVCFSENAANKNLQHYGWLTGDGTLMFPAGTNYYRMAIASVGDETALSTDDYDVVTVRYGTALSDKFNQIVKETKWLAMGDSITYGIFSTGPHTEVKNQYGWVQMLAESLNYNLTTMASRGMGYTVTGIDPEGGDDRINISTLISRATALTTDFNLITLAFGINDYNTASTQLLNVKNSLSTSITSLLTAFPKARLVVITPFNCTKEGDASTKYAYGAVHGSYTLKQLADAIKEVCDTFGVECINASDGFLFNTINITSLLLDGVHPSYDAHFLVAKNMAHFLLN